MGRIVIAAYRPKPGKQDELRVLADTHLEILQSQGLATDRKAIAMQAADGTIIEVFEWASKEAIESAHTNPVVLKMWEAYGEVCDYVPLETVAETSDLFAEFTPIEIRGSDQ